MIVSLLLLTFSLSALGQPAEAPGAPPVWGPALEPLYKTIIDIIAEVATVAILAAITYLTRGWLNVDLEKKHREALHRALTTAINRALLGKEPEARRAVPDASEVDGAAGYVRGAVPDAVRRFNLDTDQSDAARLDDLVRAKFNELTSPA